MLRALLPPDAAFAELAIAGPEPSLFPDEAAAVARAAPKRRREFAFGRACARAALGTSVAIAVGERGMPLWPPGFSGSITHTDDYAAAAVVRTGSIGIDFESLAHVARVPDLLSTVALPSERTIPAALLFSAKESVYKCLYPRVRRFLDFHDVELAFADGTFRLVRAAGCAAADIHGTYALSSTHVATVARGRSQLTQLVGT